MNRRNFKHGMAVKNNRHPVYRSWDGMKYRCLTKTSPSFKDYGGRGITICDRWLEFKNFYNDMISTWEKGLQIDRIDVNGNYNPANCRWVTRSVQNKNKRIKAEKQCVYEGVCWDKQTQSWSVDVKKRGFTTPEEANNLAKVILKLMR